MKLWTVWVPWRSMIQRQVVGLGMEVQAQVKGVAQQCPAIDAK